MKNIKIIAFLLLLCWVFSSCAGYINTRKMDLNTANTSGQIINLKYAGDNEEIYFTLAENMVRNGFLNTQGEEYGYYDIRYEISNRDHRPTHTYITNYIPALWPLYLFGLPSAAQRFTLEAHFYIFDSNGNLVKHYSKDTGYRQNVSLYRFGSRLTKRGSAEFSKLFDAIFETAASQSAQINEALREAGPISNNSNLAEVQANIDRFFRENPYATNRMY